MRIGYGKIGRSMSLTLNGCGSVGGDHEPLAVLIQLANEHPSDIFYVLGRNSGEAIENSDLPLNVRNPWVESHWSERLRDEIKRIVPKGQTGGMTVDQQIQLRDFFTNMTEQAFTMMDAHIWWVGQHGSTNSPIPMISDRTLLTKPQDWCTYYASFIFTGLNTWQDEDTEYVDNDLPKREPVYLNADPRNRHKMRDIKWPLKQPVLTQFNFTNVLKHERYGDPGDNGDVWQSTVTNKYSRLELCSLIPGTPSGDLVTFSDTWENRNHFGLFINEARAIGIRPELTRLNIMHHWVMPLEPSFIHGEWSAASSAELQGRWNIQPITPIKPAQWKQDYYRLLHSVRCTFTTPTSGSGWATTKPWEAFGAGTVCFFHKNYDSQDNILKDADPELHRWLRVDTPAQLRTRVAHLDTHREDWLWLVHAQRAHFNAAIKEQRYMQMIKNRVWSDK